MAERIPNGVAKLVVFKAFLSADHVTPATGKTIAITISKNGATSFSNPNAGATNATEMASGFYKFALDTTDTGTNGPLAWRGAVASIDDVGDVCEVVAATNGGFTALPAVAAGANGGLPLGDASGRVDIGKALGTAVTLDANNVLNTSAKYLAGTALTGRDIGASVLLSNGTGTGQLKLAAGYVAMTWADIAAPTTAVNFSGTTIATTQKVDVETIKTQAVTAAAGVTFPASIASPTNITAGTITTVTNLTNAPGAGDLTAAMKTSVENAVWDATLASHLAAGSTGAALNAAGSAGDPWVTALPGAYGAGSAGYIVGNNLNAAITSRMATYTQPTGFLAATFPGTVASPTNITAGTITTVTNLTNLPSIPANWLTAAGIAAGALNGKGDWMVSYTQPTGFLAATFPSDPADESLVIAATDAIMTRLGAPAGASVSVDIAAVKSDTTGTKAKTDSLTFAVAGRVSANITHVISDPVQQSGSSATNWGGTP